MFIEILHKSEHSPRARNWFSLRDFFYSYDFRMLNIFSKFDTVFIQKTCFGPPKILQKSMPRRLQEGIEIYPHFRRHAKAFWATKMWPCWPHVDCQDAIKFGKNRCPKPIAKINEKCQKKSRGPKPPKTNQQNKKLY